MCSIYNDNIIVDISLSDDDGCDGGSESRNEDDQRKGVNKKAEKVLRTIVNESKYKINILIINLIGIL